MPILHSVKTPDTLLGADEPAPVIVENAGTRCLFLFIGDHTGRRIPRRLGTLGLTRGDLSSHIAWDIGVAGLGLDLAARLGAAFIRQRYSRLVIDCNRAPGSAQSILEISDEVRIPGNIGLRSEDKVARVEAIYRPYHDRIAAELDARESIGQSTILVALHSFTPRLQSRDRPWRFGVLHAGDSPFSLKMLETMSAAVGPTVGDNQPYAMDETDNTVPLHRAGRVIDYLELEVRQDLVGNRADQARVAHEVAPILLQAASDVQA